ncbi:hypothetical protein J6590_101868 [Homalodisca vitripennis]|nr:hypothetical protein J6590_101868 [Homalodisca vitripennis]
MFPLIQNTSIQPSSHRLPNSFEDPRCLSLLENPGPVNSLWVIVVLTPALLPSCPPCPTLYAPPQSVINVERSYAATNGPPPLGDSGLRSPLYPFLKFV